MVFGTARLLSFISRVMTLHLSDLISTGTPSGVGTEGIGKGVNPVVKGE